MKNKSLIDASKTYFRPWEDIYEGNSQQILDRREQVTLRPLLIMQDGADDNMIPQNQEKFAASYRAAGGECQLVIFEGAEHEWIANPGPNTDRSHEGKGLPRAHARQRAA